MSIDYVKLVENFVRLNEIEIETEVNASLPYDLIIKSADGKSIAVEVKQHSPSNFASIAYSGRARLFGEKCDEYWVIFPKRNEAVDLIARRMPSKVKVYAVDELPKALGVKGDIKLDTPEAAQALQLAAIEGTRLPQGRMFEWKSMVGTAQSGGMPKIELALSRQFPTELIREMDTADREKLRQSLRIGERVPNVSVLMTDIKNFSHLVGEMPHDEMNNFMVDYYKKARDLVWHFGGIFDKFIGDAVLAMFGYPNGSDDSAIRAIKCADAIIRLGDSLVERLASQVSPVVVPGHESAEVEEKDQQKNKIYTGTRAGIATGQIWVLDIAGYGDTEISFMGDVINLASRLQSESVVNGILIDQATRYKAESADSAYMGSLLIESRQSQPKGQTLLLKVHQIHPATKQKKG